MGKFAGDFRSFVSRGHLGLSERVRRSFGSGLRTMGAKEAQIFSSGYRYSSYLINRLMNMGLALALMILAAPFLIVIPLIILIFDGRPIFYRSVRLGARKRPFTMYKFRTLVPNADEILKGELVTPLHRVTTPVGRLLRETRLDELPQLFNILRGDMDFLGPRPERPEIYESVCRHIPGYDRRFEVNPGLLGFSQIFTPHSAPKRIRVFIDNRLVKNKHRPLWDFYEIMLTAFVVIRSIIYRLWRAVVHDFWRRMVLKQYLEKRLLERVEHQEGNVFLVPDGERNGGRNIGRLVDMNELAFLVESSQPFLFPDGNSDGNAGNGEKRLLRLETRFRKMGRSGKRKVAWCRGSSQRTIEVDVGRFHHVVTYEPVSPLNSYMIHQYFLHKSVACHR